MKALEAAVVGGVTSLPGQISPATASGIESSVSPEDDGIKVLVGPSDAQKFDPAVDLPESWDMLSNQAFQVTSSPTTTSPSGHSALHRAIRTGNKSMLLLLLKHGADIGKTDMAGNSALHLAAEQGNEEMTSLLLDQGAEPDATNYLGQTPLFSAVHGGNSETVELLLARVSPNSSEKVDVDWKDAMGMSALHLAVECGSEAMAALLLAHGADINA